MVVAVSLVGSMTDYLFSQYNKDPSGKDKLNQLEHLKQVNVLLLLEFSFAPTGED